MLTRLDELLEAGTAYTVGREYVGKASDGVEVYLGLLGEEDSVNEYLKDHPTPDTW